MKTYTNLTGTKGSIKGMIPNSAGGVSFAVGDKEKLERFLMIGTFGGTYYASEKKLTDENTKLILEMIKRSPRVVLDTTTKFVVEKRLFKQDTALYVLALIITHADQDTKNEAYKMVPSYCFTATHLFTFISMCKDLRGWSKGLCNAVSRWYTNKDEDTLVYQWLKYRNRAGYTHRDVLRLAHPKAVNKRQNLIFRNMVGKDDKLLDNTQFCAFTEVQKYKEHGHGMSDIVECIQSGKLTWEMVPTELLNDKTVLMQLASTMPMMALIRNLNRMTWVGLFDRPTATAGAILDKLKNAKEVESSGIHPIFVLNAIKTYSQGKGDLSDNTWTPNQRILDALNVTFELAFKNVQQSFQNVLVAIDASGSMGSEAAGTKMSCTQLAGALTLVNLRSMPNAKVITFKEKYAEPNFGARTSYDDILAKLGTSGGTDCGQAFRYALDKALDLDAIVIYTDSETWAGSRTSHDLLAEYKRKHNKDVKVIEVAMVANSFTNYPTDSNVLRVVGYDANVPELITRFLKN